MAKYVKSDEAITTDLLLWDIPRTETSVEDVETIEIYPINSIEKSETIDFEIPGFRALMLKSVDLIVKFNILTHDDKVPAANTNVSPINNFLHALWENVEVRVNGYNVEQSMSQSYNMRAFFETCLNSDSDRADQLALAELFIMDKGLSKIQNEHLVAYANTDNTEVVLNESTHLRAERVSQGKDVTLIGKLKSSFLMQDKNLVTNLPIGITLTRNKERYCLLHADTEAYKINLKKVVLKCTFVRPKPQILRFLNEKLSKEPALYNSPRSEISTYTVPTGVDSFTIPNMYRENLPKFVVFALQNRESLSGDSHRNPYSYIPVERYKLMLDNDNYFPDSLEIIGTAIGNGAVKGVASNYSESALFLNQIYTSLGLEHRGSCLLNSKNFQGHFMMTAALTPDRTAHKHLNLQRKMDVKLEVILGHTSTAGHILVVYNLYDRFISIDSDRTVTAQ